MGGGGQRRLPSGLRHLGGDSGSIPFHSVLQQLNCERTETRLHRSRFDLKPFGESFAGRQRGEIRSKQWRAVSRENKSVTFYRLPGAGHGAASGGALGAPLCSSSNALERFKVNVDGVTRLCPTGVVVVIRESGCAAHCSPLLRDLIRTAPGEQPPHEAELRSVCVWLPSARRERGSAENLLPCVTAEPSGRGGRGGLEGRGCRGEQGHEHISPLS